MTAGTCFICEELLGEQDTSTVKRKGIVTLISASKERKDRKYEKYVLKEKESVAIHSKCYKSYINPKSIRACLRLSEKPIASSSTRRSQKFESESLCLFCGSDATETFVNQATKKRFSSPRPVRNLTMQETLIKIKNKAAERSDAWGDEVLSRVIYIEDLESSKPRYHVGCYPRFFDNRPKPNISESNLPHIIDVIEQFMAENPHQEQFSLQKIIDHVQGSSVNNQWLKKKLYEILGKDIVITSNPGSEPIIQLRDTSHKILLNHFRDTQDTTEDRLKIIKTAAKIIKDDIRSMECDTTSRIRFRRQPPLESFFENDATIIPKSLKVFLDDVISADKNGVEEDNYFPKIVAIAHAIIEKSRNMLEPITCKEDPIPSDLLEIISCGCDKRGCTSSACTCRKLGLKCTTLRKKCNGSSCTNAVEPEIILGDDEDEEDSNQSPEPLDREIELDGPIMTASENVETNSNYEPVEKRPKIEFP